MPKPKISITFIYGVTPVITRFRTYFEGLNKIIFYLVDKHNYLYRIRLYHVGTNGKYMLKDLKISETNYSLTSDTYVLFVDDKYVFFEKNIESQDQFIDLINLLPIKLTNRSSRYLNQNKKVSFSV